MNKIRNGFLIILILFLIIISMNPSSGKLFKFPTNANLDIGTLYVGGFGPGNYSKIQDAIDFSTDGDVVFVYNGTYSENIIIDKSIKLIGENRNNTIINGGSVGDVICILENNCEVTITGFSILNSGDHKWRDAGIEIRSSFNEIKDNIISFNICGILLVEKQGGVEYNIISKNIITHNNWIGIRVEDSNLNAIFANLIANNGYGIYMNPGILPCTIGVNQGNFFEDEIHGNTIINNNIGIEVSHSWGMNIFRNNISVNNIGIKLFGTYGWGGFNKVRQNNIAHNKNGIVIDCFKGGTTYNIITENNFIENKNNAIFYTENNEWDGNYWNRPRIFPKPILGRYQIDTPLFSYSIPWINFDKNPAKEPYDF